MMRPEAKHATKGMPPKPVPIALRIELMDVPPLVWRRVVVPNHWRFTTLHHYLQWVIRWWDSHAHEFQVGHHIVAPDWWIAEAELAEEAAKYLDERGFSIAAAVTELGVRGKIEYRYDMGDGWRHRLKIETPPPGYAEQGLPLPACVAGENACPPEDVGGPHGYQQFLETIGDRADDERVDLLRWIGGAFDPRGFDLNRINRDWPSHRRRRR